MASPIPPQHSEQRVVENFILVWLDEHVTGTSDAYQRFVHLFQPLINTMKLFSHLHEFQTFLQTIEDEKLFVVTSESLSEELAAQFDRQPQIHSIYIYCTKEDYHEQWTSNFPKIKGVYVNLRSIRDSLRRDKRQATNDLMPISILPLTPSIFFQSTFNYALLIREILFQDQSNDQTKKELIEYARVHYRKNSVESGIIELYEQKSTDQISPIQWFTRECFLSSMINRALRLYDTEILEKTTFFIRDLQRQIRSLHANSTDPQTLTVYYSQVVAHDEFENFKLNLHGLLSFNNFLYATVDRILSLDFVQQAARDLHSVPVIFQIEIDRSESTFPFVLLDKLDYYRDTDRYVLFSFNPIFRVVNIEHVEGKLWQINLTLIDENDNALKDVTKSVRKEFQKSKGFWTLTEMMFQTNDFNRTKKLCELLLKTTTDIAPQTLLSIYRLLGRTSQRLNDFNSALYWYAKYMNAQLSSLAPNDASLSPTFFSVGAVSQKLGNHEQALWYYQRALNNSEHGTENDPYIIARYYVSLARLFYMQKTYDKARQNFQLALKLQQKSNVFHKDALLDEINYYLKQLPAM